MVVPIEEQAFDEEKEKGVADESDGKDTHDTVQGQSDRCQEKPGEKAALRDSVDRLNTSPLSGQERHSTHHRNGQEWGEYTGNLTRENGGTSPFFC
jgi:hypothetical protein